MPLRRFRHILLFRRLVSALRKLPNPIAVLLSKSRNQHHPPRLPKRTRRLTFLCWDALQWFASRRFPQNPRTGVKEFRIRGVKVVCCDNTGWTIAQSTLSGLKAAGGENLLNVYSHTGIPPRQHHSTPPSQPGKPNGRT